VKCFRCNQLGHIGKNCRNADSSKGNKGGKGVIRHDLKGKNKGKGGKSKGKGKPGKGKKGKLNEMSSDDWEAWGDDSWWYDDNSRDVSQMSNDGSWWGDADGQTSDWESWNVASTWSDAQWTSHGGEGSTSQSGHPSHVVTDGQNSNKEDKTVSLILSPLLSSGEFECSFDICDMKDGLCDSNLKVPVETSQASSRRLPGPQKASCHQASCDFRCGVIGDYVDESPVSADLVSEFSSRGIWVREHKSFLNMHDESLGIGHDVVGVHTFSPLLSELAFANDCSWWLLDSGASVCVLSSTFGREYGFMPVEKQGHQGFKAANGTAVTMEALGTVEVQIPVSYNGEDKFMKGSMKTYLGNTRHNILSTTVLCSMVGKSFRKRVL